MRLTILAIVIVLMGGGITVSAQIETPEKGSKWVYNYVNAGSRGPIIASYDRDSILGGKSARVIDESFYEQADPRKQVYNYIGNILAIEDSIVWYWNDNQWDTLYHFGAEIGDSWNYYFDFSGEDTLKATVLNKGSDPNRGVFISLEYEYYDKDFNMLESWKDTIYELTLGGSEYIIPWDIVVMKLDGQSGGPLECFSNSKGRYSEKTWTTGGEACTDIIDKLSVDELSSSKIFSTYPNPSSGTIRISGAILPLKMEVFTVTGQQVYSSEKVFEVYNLSPEIYNVKLWRKDGKVEVHRVVVE
jgi:hypothetical protein